MNVPFKNAQQHIGCDIAAVRFVYDDGTAIFKRIKAKKKTVLLVSINK